MTANETNKSLHIDITLELRDSFRFYLDTIKTRIIIAAIVYAILVGGFTYFFWFIGEQDMLLKLSPLLFGFPAVAIIGPILRTHATYRKYFSDLSDKHVRYIFNEDGNGYDVVQGENFSHIAWTSVRKVMEKPRYFLFCFNKYDSTTIPKRFIDSAIAQSLRAILRRQIGDKAKLLE